MKYRVRAGFDRPQVRGQSGRCSGWGRATNRTLNLVHSERAEDPERSGGAWIVAAHPDDETIGATSLLLEHGISRILT